jgi:membrane protein
MKWLHRLLLNLGIYRRFVRWTKKVVPRGFAPLSLYNIFAFISHEIRDRILITRASALAFNFMLAFFPATIFLFTLIPYVHIKNFQGNLLNLISTILPHNAYVAFQKTIEDLVKHQNPKLLSAGFLSTLYFATGGISNLMQAFNKSVLIVEKRTWLKRRLIATWLFVVISILLAVAIAILATSEKFILGLKALIVSKSHFWMYLIGFSRWVIVIAIFFATISLLYRYGPANKKKWRFLSTGSILATVLASITSMGFTFYINHFASYNKIYGSIGTLIILMLYLYVNSLILLIGFELNANIDYSKRIVVKKPTKPRVNTFRK